MSPDKFRRQVEDAIWRKRDKERQLEKIRVAEERIARGRLQHEEELAKKIRHEEWRRAREREAMEKELARAERERVRKLAVQRIEEQASVYEEIEEAMDFLEEITKISS